jgi:ATP-binding cassette, subfamily B, bacterial
MTKFPFYRQLDVMDCGPTCLRMIAHYFGKIYSIDFLRDKTSINRNGVSLSGIAEGAEMIGLQSLSLAATFDMLAQEVPLPCIAHWKQRHFVIVREVKTKQSFWSKVRRQKSTDWEVHLADPAYGLIIYSKEEFMRGWIGKKNYNEESDEGIVLALEPSPQFYQLETTDEATSSKRKFSHLFAYFNHYINLL